MSSGPADAAATDRLAFELEEAAYNLRDAIKKAENGHRGWSVAVEAHVAPILREAGYRFIKVR